MIVYISADIPLNRCLFSLAENGTREDGPYVCTTICTRKNAEDWKNIQMTGLVLQNAETEPKSGPNQVIFKNSPVI